MLCTKTLSGGFNVTSDLTLYGMLLDVSVARKQADITSHLYAFWNCNYDMTFSL